MRVHFIVNGIVINTVEQDTLDNPFGYLAVADESAGPGWTYANGVFSPPESAAASNLQQIARSSYKARLRGQAATLSEQGDFGGAIDLLVKSLEA